MRPTLHRADDWVPGQPESWLERAQHSRQVRDTAEYEYGLAIRQARDEGNSWNAIGQALGLSPQGLWRKYGKNDPYMVRALND